MQTDGNVVLSATRSRRALWATGTSGAARSLAVQADGNLVLYGPGRKPLWATNTAGQGAAGLAVHDDGSLVLSWAGGRRVLAAPTTTLGAGEDLAPGQSLASPSGRFRLEMQADGNLVETEVGTGPVWATGTSGDNRAVLDASGTLLVGGATGTTWTPEGRATGTRLVVQDDGNVVLYAGTTPVWSRGDEERKRVAAADVAASTATVTPGDDYPDKDATGCGSGIYCKVGSKYSARGFAYRNCTDFVAWKLGLTWGQIADGRNGHAAGWKRGWIERGRSVGTTPKVGAVAWWSRGSHGHVAYVVAVNPDGSAIVDQYNAGGGGEFSTQTVRAESYLY